MAHSTRGPNTNQRRRRPIHWTAEMSTPARFHYTDFPRSHIPTPEPPGKPEVWALSQDTFVRMFEISMFVCLSSLLIIVRCSKNGICKGVFSFFTPYRHRYTYFTVRACFYALQALSLDIRIMPHAIGMQRTRSRRA